MLTAKSGLDPGFFLGILAGDRFGEEPSQGQGHTLNDLRQENRLPKSPFRFVLNLHSFE
jgi:hypothetical protein